MIISKSPLRMSFTGWWSDLPSFYRKYWWAVISTAIDKYIYITVNKRFDNDIRISYSKTEIVNDVENINHQLVRETLKKIWISNWIEITSIADIPWSGSWLWSSSTFTIALFHALNAFNKKYVNADLLAESACDIEINICNEPIWKQDQYASAFWWLNIIEFKEDDSVFVNPIICLNETKQRLNDNIIVFYTWITRNASNILKDQNQAYSNKLKLDIVRKMVDLTYDLKKELENNNTQAFWQILHENWLLKKQISGWISNEQIDNYYEKAMKAWAVGWKLMWAWWGWFLMFYAPKEKHENIENSLKDLKKMNVKFENEGSKIIFIH